MTEGAALGGFLSEINEMSLDAMQSTFDIPCWPMAYMSMDRWEVGDDVQTWILDKIAALKETHYLGDKEFAEATAGLATYWFQYLEGEPERQICLPEIENGKSAAKALDGILAHFDENTLLRLRSRFVKHLADIKVPPDKVKVILLDDWMLSGGQISTKVLDLFPNGYMADHPLYKYAASTEINLLIGNQRRIESGSVGHYELPPITVKAYFKAKPALDFKDKPIPDSDNSDHDLEFESRITGLHSSSDFHFGETLSSIVQLLNEGRSIKPWGENAMPPLTNIVRDYRALVSPL